MPSSGTGWVLAGYTGLTREANALGLRQYAPGCRKQLVTRRKPVHNSPQPSAKSGQSPNVAGNLGEVAARSADLAGHRYSCCRLRPAHNG